MSGFAASLRARLAELESASLLRRPKVVASPAGPYMEIGGRRVLCLCSNNYLGLASDPRLVDALKDGASLYGGGSGAAWLISGTNEVHVRAESALANWVGLPSSLLFSTGYAANVGALQALVGKGDLIISDALNHASLIDGCRLSGATVRIVPHNNPEAVRSCLREERAKSRVALVVTETVFSMDGDIADLASLRAICDEHDAGLYVDEAHALGVLGHEGAGACQMFHVKPDVLVGTLGKAFGLSGAFVAGASEVRTLLENRSRSYVFSTAQPPLLAHATLVALELVRAADDARACLKTHSKRLREGLRAAGLVVADGETPIIPVTLGQPDVAVRLSDALLREGVFVQAIRPPTVPAGTSRLRVVPIAAHSVDDIEMALAAFSRVAP